jgi:hypothetical protein
MAGRYSKGTGLFVGDGLSPESFTKIANVKGITGPGFKVDIVDTSTHSTTGNAHEKTAVGYDAGQISCTVNFDPDDPTLDPTAASGLFQTLTSLTERNYQVRLSPANPAKQMMVWKGFVTGHGFNLPVFGVQEANVTWDIDGDVDWSNFT